jgi:hypothetical protein
MADLRFVTEVLSIAASLTAMAHVRPRKKV